MLLEPAEIVPIFAENAIDQYIGKNHLMGLFVQLSKSGMRPDMIVPSLDAVRSKQQFKHVFTNHFFSPLQQYNVIDLSDARLSLKSSIRLASFF